MKVYILSKLHHPQTAYDENDFDEKDVVRVYNDKAYAERIFQRVKGSNNISYILEEHTIRGRYDEI